MELKDIKGIGPKSAELLEKIGIENIDDLVRYYPFRYVIYKPVDLLKVSSDETVVINARITSNPVSNFFRNIKRLSFQAESSSLNFKVVIYNRNYLSRLLFIGKVITLIGKYDKVKNTFVASNMKLNPINGMEIESIYHLVNGLKVSTLNKLITKVIANYNVTDLIPQYLNERYKFINIKEAIFNIHNPQNIDLLKKAKIKLKYEELFTFMFKINMIKYKNQIADEFYIKEINEDMLQDVLNIIPFDLTQDQLNSLNDIIKDSNSPKKMNRLILGDVGSGKTIVSFISIILNAKLGYQSAMLAPTEVLAKQHYDNFISLFPYIKVELLVGSTTKKEKTRIKEALMDGDIDLLIGTHAILEDDVEFNNIGLVITDEQHRFGVNQRKSLQNKGNYVDVLYLSATPIPRTYALTIYGDMDISMIKEKPNGRKEIITTIEKKKNINKIIETMREELDNNHQVYVVVPLIEENEESNLSDIEEIHNLISKSLSNYKVSMLHGKMKQAEKDSIMESFKNNETNILVSTTVIEVGVDVKNATLMVIFNAEMFGLATMHQLRGRVGRNSYQSKCILVSDYDKERLKILCESNDGFYLSECDFRLRGSGDLFGVKQSGDMNFKIANIKDDYKILMQCKKDSEEFILNNIEYGFRSYEYYSDLVKELMNNE